jgi:hypothetical protein
MAAAAPARNIFAHRDQRRPATSRSPPLFNKLPVKKNRRRSMSVNRLQPAEDRRHHPRFWH